MVVGCPLGVPISYYNIVARGLLDLQLKFQKLCMAMDLLFMQLLLTFCQRLSPEMSYFYYISSVRYIGMSLPLRRH